MKKINTFLRRRGGSSLDQLRIFDGFTFVEILVAAAIAAVTIAVAALAYSAIVSRSPTIGEIDVSLPSGVANNFYAITNNNVVSVGVSPSFGELGRAQAMRERLEEDLRGSIFAVCLVRNGQSIYRPTTINVGLNFNQRSIIRPRDFRVFLGSSGASFTDYIGAATNAANVSVFIFGPSTNAAALNVQSIYESDMVPTSSPAGLYGSVRRYSGGLLTDFYHVFYAGVTSNSFFPPVVYFDRSVLGTITDANSPTPLRQAPASPFYFLWWPDPERYTAAHTNSFIQEANTAQPRSLYWRMAYRSSYFFVIPALPAL